MSATIIPQFILPFPWCIADNTIITGAQFPIVAGGQNPGRNVQATECIRISDIRLFDCVASSYARLSHIAHVEAGMTFCREYAQLLSKI